MNELRFGLRFCGAWVLAFVVWFAGAYVINAQLIDYMPIVQLFRPWDQELSLYPVLILADLLFTAALVWFYARSVQPRPWFGQGVRFGASVIPLSVAPMYLRYYVAQPVPAAMVIQQVVFFGVLLMMVAVIIAFVYRNSGASA
jgi:hypothetical protein